MIAEILSTGDEVRTGAVADTNAAFIAQSLEGEGLEVARHQCVGDDVDTIAAVMREISRRAAVALVTGGLGPTADDVTAAGAARALEGDLAPDAAAMAVVERFFARRGRPVTATNRKQGLLPVGAACLDNPLGSAPGFAFTLGRCRFYCLPGVPVEMRAMLAETVLPDIRGRMGRGLGARRVRVITTFGIPESTVADRLAGFEAAFEGIRLGLRAHFPEIHVRLYFSEADPENLARREQSAVDWVRQRISSFVVSDEGLSLAEVVGRRLTARGASLVVAESCTGGLISSWITDVAGSSAYFRLGTVTYADEAKQDVLGVSPETLARHGAVSRQTVMEMAAGARRRAGAAYGLATSGIAGPGGGSAQKPVGSLCIGVATAEGVRAAAYRFGANRRRANKVAFAAAALNLLRIVIEQGLAADLEERGKPIYAHRLELDSGAGPTGSEAEK
ncbi:MAG: CinA family nicotinamide mononucleotide deamidase-related protein [Desulfobacteraceae bacterium]|jgi:nicotinamide-nucleotide amidase|nr:CinA family nicotinamide mononucleotide deamidase-related protein [Desulfobacteraceae bacterium]